MNLFGKLQNQYESLWKQIIRPPRAHYSQEALGPTKFNLEVEEVQRLDFQLQDIQDNVFQGSVWIPSNRKGCPCVVYLHSSAGNRAEGMEYLGKLIKSGYSLCTFDFSGCGNADGNFITMGYYQQHQVNQVIDYLKQTLNIEMFCLWGREMGAVSALQAMGKTIDVKVCIMDTPYKSLKSWVQEQLKKQYKIPSLLISGAIKMISKTIEDKAGFDIQNVNPCKFSAPGLYLPGMFMFVSSEDGSLTDNDKKLFEAYAGKDKKYHLIPEKQSAIRKEQLVDCCLQFIAEYLTSSPTAKQSQKEFDFFEVAPNPKTRQQSDVTYEFDNRQVQRQEQIKKEPKKTKDYSLKGIFSFFLPDSQPDHSAAPPKPNVADLKDDYNQMRKQLFDLDSEHSGKRVQNGHSGISNKNSVIKTQSKEALGVASIDLNRWVYVSID